MNGYDLGIRRNEIMGAGKHTSIRVALAVPPALHEQISAWAEAEGRPVASLCMFLIEQSLRQAQRDGIAPSLTTENTGDVPSFPGMTVTQVNKKRDGKSFTNTIHDRIANHGITEGSIVSEEQVNEENEINTLVGVEAAQGKYIKPDGELSKKDLILQKLSELLLD